MTNSPMSIADPMPRGTPALDRWSLSTGPGPLSPAWPRPPEPTPPINEWAATSRTLSALRRACWTSLRDDADTAPYMLSCNERAELDAMLDRIKAANAELRFRRIQVVAAWPSPVLPRHVLFGARELAAFLGAAIAAADTLARYAAMGQESHKCLS